MEQAYVSPRELAQILRLDIKSVYAALRRHEIPAVKVGRDWKVPVSFLGLPMPQAPGSKRSVIFYEQLALFEAKPVRVWRNNRKPIRTWDYDLTLWGVRN